MVAEGGAIDGAERFIYEVAISFELHFVCSAVDIEYLINDFALLIAVAIAVGAEVVSIGVGVAIRAVSHDRLAMVANAFVIAVPHIVNPWVVDAPALGAVDAVDEAAEDFVASIAQVGIAHEDYRAAIVVGEDCVGNLSQLSVLSLLASASAIGVHVSDVNIDFHAVGEGHEVVAVALADKGICAFSQAAGRLREFGPRLAGDGEPIRLPEEAKAIGVWIAGCRSYIAAPGAVAVAAECICEFGIVVEILADAEEVPFIFRVDFAAHQLCAIATGSIRIYRTKYIADILETIDVIRGAGEGAGGGGGVRVGFGFGGVGGLAGGEVHGVAVGVGDGDGVGVVLSYGPEVEREVVEALAREGHLRGGGEGEGVVGGLDFEGEVVAGLDCGHHAEVLFELRGQGGAVGPGEGDRLRSVRDVADLAGDGAEGERAGHGGLRGELHIPELFVGEDGAVGVEVDAYEREEVGEGELAGAVGFGDESAYFVVAGHVAGAYLLVSIDRSDERGGR